ncbi:hemagluttinin family protein, partial [Trypanosoma theileri]
MDVKYVTPLDYAKGGEANTFTVVLSEPGEYQLYLGTRSTETDPKIRHNVTITVAPCDPCGFSPTYSFIESNVSMRFESATGSGGNSLSLQDKVRIVPVSQGTTGRPCENPTGPFAALTLDPNASESSTAMTVFNFFAGNTSEYLGDYYICYQKSASQSNYAIVTDTTGKPVTFSIYPQLSTRVVPCLDTPSYLQAVLFTFELDTTSYPKLTFSDKDEFFLLPGNVECNAEGASNASGVIHSVFDKLEGDNVSLWVSKLPDGHETKNYKLCFRLQAATVFHAVTRSPLSVSPQDPATITTKPAFITPETDSFSMFIYGTKLSAQDEVYVVNASERCDERCDETLTPTPLPAAEYTKSFVNETLLELNFTKAIGTDVALAVCYRRAQSLLVRLAVYHIGNRNPTSYNTSFVPRLGTRPLLTFLGVGLSKNDRVMIVNEGAYCDEAE